MTYIDHVKCQNLLRDTDGHFKKTKIVNFDIHQQARAEKVPENLLKKYQTLQENSTKQYPKEYQKKFLDFAFRTDRPDIYFEKKNYSRSF